MPDDTFVTLKVVKSLLQSQTDAFKSTFSLLIQDIKEELKSVKNDINDLKDSVQFTQAKFDDVQRKCESINVRVFAHAEEHNAINNHSDATEAQLEFLENQSRRSNIRITGVVEDKNAEKSWDDTERVVKQVIKNKLNLQKDFEIECCHSVNRRSNGPNRSGRPDGQRLIVAKLAKWKDKERILKRAREIKPDGIKFLVDLSWRTMIKREEQVPEMLAARKIDCLFCSG